MFASEVARMNGEKIFPLPTSHRFLLGCFFYSFLVYAPEGLRGRRISQTMGQLRRRNIFEKRRMDGEVSMITKMSHETRFSSSYCLKFEFYQHQYVNILFSNVIFILPMFIRVSELCK